MMKWFRFLAVVVLILYIVPAVTSAGSQTPTLHPLLQKASVTLTGLPQGAKVYVGRSNLDYGGISPTYGSKSVQLSLNPGRHTLNVKAGGYQSWSQTISVSPGERKTIMVALSPIPRQTAKNTPVSTPTPTQKPVNYLTVEVSPREATITIDGTGGVNIHIDSNQKSPTRRIMYSISPGTHTVQATATGYLPKTEQIQINSGDNSYLSISLDKDPNPVAPPVTLASFEMTSRPTGASVYVDGELNGTTPCVISAPVGPHTVMLRVEGYQDRTETVEIIKTYDSMPQKIFWILTPEDVQTSPSQLVQTETQKHAVEGTVTTTSNLQQEEPVDLLQHIIYLFRGLQGIIWRSIDP